jgi:hypothetical protein
MEGCTNEERIAQVQRITDRLLDEMERQQTQPRLISFGRELAAFVAAGTLFLIAALVARHFV